MLRKLLDRLAARLGYQRKPPMDIWGLMYLDRAGFDEGVRRGYWSAAGDVNWTKLSHDLGRAVTSFVDGHEA